MTCMEYGRVLSAGPLMVTRYLPAARTSRVGVERLSSFRAICCLLRSSTILSMSPHGDAERSSAPCPAGMFAGAGAEVVTAVLAVGGGAAAGRGAPPGGLRPPPAAAPPAP